MSSGTSHLVAVSEDRGHGAAPGWTSSLKYLHVIYVTFVGKEVETGTDLQVDKLPFLDRWWRNGGRDPCPDRVGVPRHP